MKKLLFSILIILLAPILAIFLFFPSKPSFTQALIEKNSSFNVYKSIFKASDNQDIYALLFLQNKESSNLVIILPGAGGTKESRKSYAEFLIPFNYSVLILDQRGIGETKAPLYSLEQDFNNFLNKKPVSQYLMVLDVLSAINSIKEIKNINNIALLGESMGGRNAILASALDKRIKGLIIISSAGYSQNSPNSDVNRFFSYINPNFYISKISPSRILMLHSKNDNIISIEEAQRTFSLAKEPKTFVSFNETECIHGYCLPMFPYIKEGLEKIFNN